MAQLEDKDSAAPTNGERLAPLQVNGAGETPLGVLRSPEPLLRLRRTWGVWQIPELDAQDAKALLELWPLGSFLVTGHSPSQDLVLRTGPSPGEVKTYQINKIPGGVSLESSNVCMPDLPHLLAFLSASRDVLPRRLLLPPPTLGPGNEHTVPPQTGRVQLDASGKALSVVNQLYLEMHKEQRMEQSLPETPPETAQRNSPAPSKPTPHRVSWVEGPLSPEVHYPGPALATLVEKEEEVEDAYRDEEEGPEDALTLHVRALARSWSSYVARQFRHLQDRLTSAAGSSHRPGDPATELLQDVQHLLTDLQEYLVKDPEVRAVFESRGPGAAQKDQDLGNEEFPWKGTYGHFLISRGFWFTISWPCICIHIQLLSLQSCAYPFAFEVFARPARWKGRQLSRPWESDGRCLRAPTHPRACPPVSLEPQGADAFLPALAEELIWSPNIGETQLDVEFLMELLDPNELRGEAGYYLTTWFGALHHIAHYQPDVGRAPQGLSSEARASLRQWHRRRTLHGHDRASTQADLPFEEPWAGGTEPGNQ
ncbi:ras and Rab interactor-like protein [Trichechus manatus latirostris]|uniref:Ras and Rab interactor-like protein n=1 Tax=Trichechus manatus latirostris TaxID=127582 RepID=A0A2Y9RSZ0_TRIMA|nr:ras and Rab interactor-like protein [Trichechus manatus latirostris]